MMRNLEFDISELAPVTFMIGASRNMPMKALPIFLHRRFHYHDLTVNPNSGIRSPSDLEGKSVGIRAYTVTTAVWVRELLSNRYGVDLSKVRWIVDDDEHVHPFDLPGNVTRLPPGQSIADEFALGRIDAALGGIGGVGRKGDPTGTWDERTGAPAAHFEAVPLIPSADAVAATAYRETGVYPVHKLIVIKDDAVARLPELPAWTYDAFTRAKAAYLDRVNGTESVSGWPGSLGELREIVGPDPFPYGMAANRATLETLLDFCKRQKMVHADLELEEIFFSGF